MSLADKAERILYADRLEPGDRPLAGVLSALSLAFEAGARARGELYRSGVFRSVSFPGPVVSIGNLTLGGTGKTPMAVHAARLLKELGLCPAVVSRGYGGSLSRAGGAVSDGKALLAGPEQAGDEPYLMALTLPGVPVLVGADRSAAGSAAFNSFGARSLVLDDGFQHRKVARDLDILLVDQARPFGNGRLFPRGSLREPAAKMRRAHAVVLTRSNGETPRAVLKNMAPGTPVFHARHKPVGLVPVAFYADPVSACQVARQDLSTIAGLPVAAFSGIAKNEDFFQTLRALGAALVFSRGFADHHPFSAADIEAVARSAERAGARMIVTTEKDAVRLAGLPVPGIPSLALGVGMEFLDGDSFDQWFADRVPIIARQKEGS